MNFEIFTRPNTTVSQYSLQHDQCNQRKATQRNSHNNQGNNAVASKCDNVCICTTYKDKEMTWHDMTLLDFCSDMTWHDMCIKAEKPCALFTGSAYMLQHTEQSKEQGRGKFAGLVNCVECRCSVYFNLNFWGLPPLQGVFLHWASPKKLKYGEPRLGESTLT